MSTATDGPPQASSEMGFYLAQYDIDGLPETIDFRKLSELSPKWLGLCGEFLREYGDSFDAAWSGPLARFRIRFTSAPSVALATVLVHGRVAASLALVSGQAPSAEKEVLELFVASLRGVRVVQAAAASSEPFGDLAALVPRPLMVVVPWPDPEISDEDYGLVSELSIHLAGAFFAGLAQDWPPRKT